MTTPLIMLALLVAPYVLLRPVPALRNRPALRGCIGLAAVFGFTGIGHFVAAEEMAQMIPPAVPARTELIYASGIVEILAGAAVLVPRWRRPAGWFLIALLVLLLPFNVYAAVERIPFGGHSWGPAYLLVRVPLQLILIAWTARFAVRAPRPTHDARHRPL